MLDVAVADIWPRLAQIRSPTSKISTRGARCDLRTPCALRRASSRAVARSMCAKVGGRLVEDDPFGLNGWRAHCTMRRPPDRLSTFDTRVHVDLSRCRTFASAYIFLRSTNGPRVASGKEDVLCDIHITHSASHGRSSRCRRHGSHADCGSWSGAIDSIAAIAMIGAGQDFISVDLPAVCRPSPRTSPGQRQLTSTSALTAPRFVDSPHIHDGRGRGIRHRKLPVSGGGV